VTATVTRPAQQRAGHFARLWWLPAGGDGNEAALLAAMPSLAREAAGRGDSAWR
jgi:hypothetical protein